MPEDIVAHGKLKRVTISAVVTRADGRVEDLGVIADSKRWRGLGHVVTAVLSKLKEAKRG